MKKSYLLILVLLCSGIASVRAQVDDVLIFNGTNGANPNGSLTLSGNRLYGTTSYGGSNNFGTVFVIDTDKTHYKELIDFNGEDSAEGLRPYGDITLAGNKAFGMTSIGGSGGEGCIFSVDTAGGNYKDLFDFSSANGVVPWGNLQLIGNNLYGLTSGGGTGTGVIFRIDTSGKNYKVLFNFDLADGSDSYGSLTLVGNKFYGMEQFGGTNSDGTVFSIDTGGAPASFKVLVDFDGTSYPQGSTPLGDVTYLNGKLYGMTAQGGAHGVGVIFSVDTSGNNYKDILDFDGTNGSSGAGSLLVVDSLLYGMTQIGGTGYGNIFSIDTSGKVFTTIVNFSGTNADFPSGSLILSNGIFYGTTYNGGGLNEGVVFSTNTCKLTVSIDSINVACYGDSTGAAIAVLRGGQAPFTYEWNNGATTDTAATLMAGTYTVTVIDTKGCISFASAIINQPAAPLSVAHDSTDDNGTCNGIASVRVFGGTPPYTYLWSTGKQTTDTIENQCAGTYSVTITDSNGCILTTTVTINSSAGINIIDNSPVIIIYPEPNNGYFIVNGLMPGQIVELYNYLGERLSSAITDNTIVNFNISDQLNGLYFIRVLDKCSNVQYEQKVIKVQ